RQVANALSSVGSARETKGDLAGALAAYRRALALNVEVARRDTTDADVRRELAYSYNTLAVAQRKSGDLAGALANHRAELALWSSLAAGDTSASQYGRPLGNAH